MSCSWPPRSASTRWRTSAGSPFGSPLSQFIQPEGSRHILGLGLLPYGVIGVIGARAVSGERRYRWGALAVDLLAIVLGCLTMTRQPGATGNLQRICGILVVGGVALLVLAYVMWQRGPRAGGA